jgi:hypothetical protein
MLWSAGPATSFRDGRMLDTARLGRAACLEHHMHMKLHGTAVLICRVSPSAPTRAHVSCCCMQLRTAGLAASYGLSSFTVTAINALSTIRLMTAPNGYSCECSDNPTGRPQAPGRACSALSDSQLAHLKHADSIRSVTLQARAVAARRSFIGQRCARMLS